MELLQLQYFEWIAENESVTKRLKNFAFLSLPSAGLFYGWKKSLVPLYLSGKIEK